MNVSMRESRSAGEAVAQYSRSLTRACGALEQELRARSFALARAQGLSAPEATNKAQSAVNLARAQLMAVYAQ